MRRWRSGHGDGAGAAQLSADAESDPSLVEEGDEPLIRLARLSVEVDPDDEHAAYKHAVAGSSLADPLATLRGLAEETGVPVGAIARHVLVQWASAGSAGLLRVGPDAVDDLARGADAVDEAPQGLARDEAWAALRGRIHWLAHGVREPDTTYPDGGAGVVRRRRVGAYGLAVDDTRGVLLCRVAEGYPGSHRWTLPGGGLEHGEDPHDGLVREVAEEAGLPAQVGEFLLVDSHHIVRDERDLHLLRLVWRITVPTDEPPRVLEQDGSTADVAWITPDRLQSLPLLSIATKALEAAGHTPPPPDQTDGSV